MAGAPRLVDLPDPLLYADVMGSFAQNSPGPGWASSPALQSSDVVVRRNKDSSAADARDVSRTNAWGKSARRSTVDAIIGAKFTLQLSPDWEYLGVSPDVAADWAESVENEWNRDAESTGFHLDAQRKQTFTGLMRTAYSSAYVSGEALGTVEWKESWNGTSTCLNLLAPERLCDPDMGSYTFDGSRRMGIERGVHGEPLAYWFREKHASDGVFGAYDVGVNRWKRIDRYTGWGRQQVLHWFEQDQPDMTRGLTSYMTSLLPMRLLSDYVKTELESAAIRATYAAVIQSELDYKQALEVIGEDHRGAIEANPVLDVTLNKFASAYMAERASFYRGQEIKFGKSKVAHLLPNEELKMIQSSQSAGGMKDFTDINLYTLASGLGVDHATLTKNYTKVNYSGARAALFDVWRSYEVRRSDFISGFAMPFVACWLEEKIVVKQKIPMLGNLSFRDAKDAVCRGTFETWSKPRLDPQKENAADMLLYDKGLLSARDICGAEGRDWRRVLDDRARQIAHMKRLGMEPEDLDWTLIMNKGKQDPNAASGSSGDSGGTGSNS